MSDNETMTEEVIPTPEEVLQNLQENSVPREEAEAWRDKYYRLFRDYAAGNRLEPEKDLKTLRDAAVKAIQQKEVHTPLEHIEALLTIDDYEVQNGQRSIFLPSIGDVDEATQNSAERVRALLEKVRDQANGSNEVAAALIGNALRDVK